VIPAQQYYCTGLSGTETCLVLLSAGLFAKLSMTELRARQGVCSGTCNTYHCYKVKSMEVASRHLNPACLQAVWVGRHVQHRC
jgi:hypothetical protein